MARDVGGNPAEERGENLVSCVRNLPGLATMLFLCVTRQRHVSASHARSVLLRRVTVNTCLCHQTK